MTAAGTGRTFPPRSRCLAHSHPDLRGPAIHRHHSHLGSGSPPGHPSQHRRHKRKLRQRAVSHRNRQQHAPRIPRSGRDRAVPSFHRWRWGYQAGILALACFLPEQCIEIYEAAKTGDFAKAAAIRKSVLTASRKIVAEAGIPGVKYAMDAAGYYGGPPRSLFLPLTATQRDAIDAALAGLIPSTCDGPPHPPRRLAPSRASVLEFVAQVVANPITMTFRDDQRAT